jgi:hypothetical protein
MLKRLCEQSWSTTLNSAKVHTPKLSTIYRLGTNKKDLNEVDFNKMVELVGTAPTSEGLAS